jgi:hypothetical protein
MVGTPCSRWGPGAAALQGGMPNAHVVLVPNLGHDVFGTYDCIRTTRNTSAPSPAERTAPRRMPAHDPGAEVRAALRLNHPEWMLSLGRHDAGRGVLACRRGPQVSRVDRRDSTTSTRADDRDMRRARGRPRRRPSARSVERSRKRSPAQSSPQDLDMRAAARPTHGPAGPRRPFVRANSWLPCSGALLWGKKAGVLKMAFRLALLGYS